MLSPRRVPFEQDPQVTCRRVSGEVLHDADSAIESGKQNMYPGVHVGSVPVGGRRQVGRGRS